ncbi:MAG: methylmalonyl-CoA mutase family protein [Planctomycetota bacterium]|nr:methylmalonyl-CoA mutase family protein [Planctomycetota bacterium]MDI6788019.1 methylmalonyl-CoA mutase family protein [Planctomycetota bacterium]
MKRFYSPSDIVDCNYQNKLGSAGEYPFTRGIHPTMYSGKLWTMRQYSGFATAEETNRRFKFLLKQGQTGLSVAFDLPTQMGYDADHPMSKGEIGKTGVNISSLVDMETLFDEIPLDKISVSMTINATCAIILGMYLVLSEKQNSKSADLSGTVQNDILKEYVARGAYIFPPQPSLRLVVDIIEYCLNNIPRWNFISVSGYHIREAGSTASQEIGFTLSNGIAYVQGCLERGLDINEIGKRVSFFLNAHNDFFEEVAKFRAARRLWAGIMKERFKATDPRAMMLRFHTQTAGCTLTAQQPDNNITRVALQAMSAVLGGTQSLHTNSRDEALSLPTEKSVQIALKTQQLIAYETAVSKVVDPFGGSYYLENLSDKLEEEATRYIDEIDKLGGAVKAIETGYYQKEISRSAYEYQKEIENQKRIIVGVNRFSDKDSVRRGRIKTLKVTQELQRKATNKITQYKKKRKGGDKKRLENALKEVKSVAQSNANLMPVIMEAIKSNATLGEISQALREVFGEHKGAVIF